MMITVMYVDDEEALRETFKEILEMNAPDMKVFTFCTPKEALANLKKTQPDAIVSDYAMNPEDGISFLLSVRQVYDVLPFIMFTGRGREDVVIQALNEGADFYLQKGGDVKATFVELEHMIRKSVERRTNEKTILKLKAALMVLPK